MKRRNTLIALMLYVAGLLVVMAFRPELVDAARGSYTCMNVHCTSTTTCAWSNGNNCFVGVDGDWCDTKPCGKF